MTVGSRRTMTFSCVQSGLIISFIFTLSTLSESKRFQGYHIVIQRQPPEKQPQKEMFAQSKLCATTNHGGSPYRYFKPTRRCYVVGEKGPCGEMMEFTMKDGDFGVCDCSTKLRCGRPLIYWPPERRCYPVNDQGPCANGEWLVFGFYQMPVCTPNPCEEFMIKSPSHRNNFWFEHRGRCFKTGTRAFCASNEIALNKWREYFPKCYGDDTMSDCDRFPVHKVDCLPGMKEDIKAACIKKRLKKKTQQEV